MELNARLFHCLRCHRRVIICSTCDHGNIYCGLQCATITRKESVRAAGQRYQNTRRGKQKHAERQRRYRERKKQKVTHRGSNENTDKSNSLSQDSIAGCRCHFCKKRVPEYLRSDFLSSGSWMKRTVTAHNLKGPG